ncbi:MCP four helix bundle domain-containing protein, partial [Palleronia marisminoris]
MRMTIKTKLIAVFAVLIALLGVSSFLAVNRASLLKSEITKLADETAFQLEQSLIMKAATTRTMSVTQAFLAQNDPVVAAELVAVADAQIETVNAAAENVRDIMSTEETRALLEDFDAKWAAFVELQNQVEEIGTQKTNTLAADAYERSVPIYAEVFGATDGLLESVRNRIATAPAVTSRVVELESATDGTLDALRALNELNRDMMIEAHDEDLQGLFDGVEPAIEAVEASYAEALARADGTDRTVLEALGQPLAAYLDVVREITQLNLINSDAASDIILNTQLEPVFLETVAAADLIAKRSSDVLDIARAEAISVYEGARNLLVALGTGAFIVAIAAAFWLSTTISRGLSRAVTVAREVARGNLEVDAKTTSRDEIGVLLNAMDGMVVDLKEMSRAAESIAAGDLRADVTPRSDDDRLGIALRDMVIKLREVI